MKKVLSILAVLTALCLAPLTFADAPADLVDMLDPVNVEAPALDGEAMTEEQAADRNIGSDGLPTLAFAEGIDLAFVSDACTDFCDHHYDICIDKCGPNPTYVCSRNCDVETIECYRDCG